MLFSVFYFVSCHLCACSVAPTIYCELHNHNSRHEYLLDSSYRSESLQGNRIYYVVMATNDYYLYCCTCSFKTLSNIQCSFKNINFRSLILQCFLNLMHFKFLFYVSIFFWKTTTWKKVIVSHSANSGFVTSQQCDFGYISLPLLRIPQLHLG